MCNENDLTYQLLCVLHLEFAKYLYKQQNTEINELYCSNFTTVCSMHFRFKLDIALNANFTTQNGESVFRSLFLFLLSSHWGTQSKT